jgi:hypothetical protein
MAPMGSLQYDHVGNEAESSQCISCSMRYCSGIRTSTETIDFHGHPLRALLDTRA